MVIYCYCSTDEPVPSRGNVTRRDETPLTLFKGNLQKVYTRIEFVYLAATFHLA
jgi:hypothetical protein